jgi:hypothetical protein
MDTLLIGAACACVVRDDSLRERRRPCKVEHNHKNREPRSPSSAGIQLDVRPLRVHDGLARSYLRRLNSSNTPLKTMAIGMPKCDHESDVRERL